MAKIEEARLYTLYVLWNNIFLAMTIKEENWLIAFCSLIWLSKESIPLSRKCEFSFCTLPVPARGAPSLPWCPSRRGPSAPSAG